MDPKGHHITLRDEPARVEVTIDGETLASSTRAVVLEETGLPPRFYFPREDVRMERLESTPTETVCPFKGQASYWSVTVGDTEHRDVAWAYDEPIDAMVRIAGLVCFYSERTDTTLAGETLARPDSPWSKAKA